MKHLIRHLLPTVVLLILLLAVAGVSYQCSHPKEIVVQREVEVPVIVEKPIIVETIVYSELRDFDSLETLENFLAESDIDQQTAQDKVYDCDDFARDLQREAESHGWRLNVVLEPPCSHMKNMAIIGNELYAIEPQNDTVTFLCVLDTFE